MYFFLGYIFFLGRIKGHQILLLTDDALISCPDQLFIFLTFFLFLPFIYYILLLFIYLGYKIKEIRREKKKKENIKIYIYIYKKVGRVYKTHPLSPERN